MTEEPMKSIIISFTRDAISEQAEEELAKLFEGGYGAARDAKFPAHRDFREFHDDVMKREGFVDAWLSFICLSTFALGISVGRGATKIETSDVFMARDTICDKWPDCTVMKLEAFSAALPKIREWYDKGGQHRMSASNTG